MPVMQLPLLEEDPCGRAKALRRIRDRLITGQQEFEIEYRANEGVGRRLRYSQADMSRLDAEIAEAMAACAAETGEAPRARRFAIQAGYRRRW